MKFTPEQQAERRKGIGASEAAAALGVCPWKSRFQLWAEKTGKADPPDLDAVEAVEWGDILEAVICETFAKRTGRRVHHNEGQAMEHHSKHDFMFDTGRNAVGPRADRLGGAASEDRRALARQGVGR